MEADFIDLLVMGVVVLKKTFASEIPEFDLRVYWAAGYTCSVGVEDDCSYGVQVVSEAVDFLALGQVPYFYSSIVWGGNDYSGVRGELGASNPVGMGSDGGFEVMNKLITAFMHPFW